MRKRARRRSDDVERIVQRYWVQKYNRPATDPLWLDQPFSEHLTEFFEDRWRDREEVQKQLLDPDVSPLRRSQLMDHLDALDKVLDLRAEIDETTSMGDILEDYWLWQEEQGEEPDMDMTIEQLQEMGWSR